MLSKIKKTNEFDINDIIIALKNMPFENYYCGNKRIEFVFESERVVTCDNLINEWEIPHIDNNCSSMFAIIKLMKWFKNKFDFERNINDSNGIESLIDTMKHNELYEMMKKRQAIFIPKFEALFFNYILLASGFKSRLVECMSIGFIDNNRCYAVEAYLEDYNKWVAVDICNNSVYYDYNHIPINLIEIRKCITDKKEFFVFSNNDKIKVSLFNMWATYLFRLKYCLNNEIDFLTKRIVAYGILTPKLIGGHDKMVNGTDLNQKIVYLYSSSTKDFYDIPD